MTITCKWLQLLKSRGPTPVGRVPVVTLNSERSQLLLEEESLTGTLLMIHQSPIRLPSVDEPLTGFVVDIVSFHFSLQIPKT